MVDGDRQNVSGDEARVGERGTEGRGSTTEVNQVVPTGGSATATVTPSICDGLDVPEGQVAPSTGSDILGAGTASRQAKDLQAGNKGDNTLGHGNQHSCIQVRHTHHQV